MTIAPAREKNDLVQLIRYAYGDSNGYATRSLDFKSERVSDWQTLSEALRAIGRYNEFDPEKVLNALKQVWGDISSVQIGRESSPAIYIDLPYWDNQRIKGADSAAARRLTAEETESLVQIIKKALDWAIFDEFSVEKNTIRVWWD
jgi:hypothetical protein